jgi:hypothetical protein
MKIFAISDLHLSFQTDKPMDLFGEHWKDYEKRVMDDWNKKVGASDVGIIAGDISWAMRINETQKDFDYLAKLNGTKIIVRGNHDYWWSTISKVRENLPSGVLAIHNDSLRMGKFVFAGTRGWKVPERRATQDKEDKKIFDREVGRFELSLQDAKKKMKDGDTLIAIIHYPPFNATRDDSPFTQLCEKYGVKACIYGHLHGTKARADIITKKNNVKYYLTSCDMLDFKVIRVLV